MSPLLPRAVTHIHPLIPRAVPVNSHCLAKRLGQTHFWIGPNLWLCQRTFPTVRRTRCAPPIKYTLLWTVLWVPNSGTIESPPPPGLQWSMQFSYRYERVTCLSPSYFSELAVVLVVTWYTHSSEKAVTMMVPFPLSSSSVILFPHFNYQ